MKTYECEGQMNIFDILGQEQNIREPSIPGEDKCIKDGTRCRMRPCTEAQGVKCCGECEFKCESRCKKGEPKAEPNKWSAQEVPYEFDNPILNHLIEDLKEVFEGSKVEAEDYYVWPWVPKLGKRLSINVDNLPEDWDATEVIEKYMEEYQLEVSISQMGVFQEEQYLFITTFWKTPKHVERTDWKESVAAVQEEARCKKGELKEKTQVAAVMYECGEWVKDHGKRLMFEELEENKFYIHDYSTTSNEFFKVVYTKKKTEDTIMYVDSPRGIKAKWSWGNSFSALSRKDWVNDDESHNGWFYEMHENVEQEETIQQPCGRPCDVEWCSKECFLKRGRVWNTKDGGWARDSQGETLKCKDRECDYEPDEFEDCFSDQEEAEAKKEKKEPQPLDIRGICDDGYCPNCGHPFDEYLWPEEIDCEVCPECGTQLDWERWHLHNDKKTESEVSE